MAVQRFRSEVDRTRRVLGAILIALALVLIQWLIRVEIAAGRVTVTALESLARAWGVPCGSLGGTVRGPDQLDMPLYERLRDDAEARKEAPLPPEWGIRIEPLSLGYAMRSTLRSWAPMRRLSRMAFREIEERIASHPIELIGDRRTLKLGETFCKPGAVKAVAHEYPAARSRATGCAGSSSPTAARTGSCSARMTRSSSTSG